MNNKYSFYYDESGHSRVLTEETVTADNYDDFFIAIIVGVGQSKKSSLESDYKLFEQKYKKIYQVDELKSTVLSNKKYKLGFNSFKKDDLCFISEFLELIIRHNLLIYISVQNKIEYLVEQLLKNYENNYLIDADAIKYSVTKAISVYRPLKVMESMYKGKSFSQELRNFLEEKIAFNGCAKLKESENQAFKEAYLLIDVNKEISILDWDYIPPFAGFSYFLKEHHIETNSIIIDKEGSGKTLNAAFSQGFQSSFERDSTEEIGIRIADILAGLINGFISSIFVSTRCVNSDVLSKKLLDNRWFALNDLQIDCYNKMRKVVITQNESWYKTYCSNYSGPFLYLICLLNYVSQKGKERLLENYSMNNEYLNNYVCLCLKERFDMMRSKLKIEPAIINENGYFVNQRGAKEYLDKDKRKLFFLKEGESKRFYVLSAGIFHSLNVPTITIQTEDGPVAYDLPQELYEWALTLVGFANMGTNLLPEYVVFTKSGGKYFADIE